MKLPNLTLAILDTETTGFIPRVHKVIEYACVIIKNGKIETTYEELFALNEPVPPHIEAITRITTADLAGKEKISDRIDALKKMIPDDAIIVGQNIPFDIRMLKGEGLDLSDRPWIDTSMLASIVFPELRSYSLGYASTILHLPHEPKHRALGDVHATTAFLEKCYERLCELTDDQIKMITEVSAKGPQGYRAFFASIPASRQTDTPKWLAIPDIETFKAHGKTTIDIAEQKGGVELIEEPLNPTWTDEVLTTLSKKSDTEQYWIAVKNIERSVRRLDLPKGTSVIYPPDLLVDADAVDRFLSQESFTEDELTLAIKLRLYEPKKMFDLPIHGEEYAVWDAKVACTNECTSYKKHLKDQKNIVIVDQQHLLKNAEAIGIPEKGRIIIEDASMLEDTATKAYGWICNVSTLRAAASEIPELTKFVDLLQIWCEKTRRGNDLRYLAPSDLQTPEADAIVERIEELSEKKYSAQVQSLLSDLKNILDERNVSGRIVWLETYQNGDQCLQSVPESIADLLEKTFYDRYTVSLEIPPGMAGMLPAILSRRVEPTLIELPEEKLRAFPIAYPEAWELADWIMQPKGKNVLLCSGRKAIEDIYVKYAKMLETRGITLLCQGMSGGQGRMQAEFEAANAPAIFVTTPWMYEGVELPPQTVDHLIITSLPFDHPAHAVIGRRSEQFPNAFRDYNFPRVLHRLFRLLRTYSRHRTKNGDMILTDKRLHFKDYGKDVKRYLNQFSAGENKEKQMELL